MTTAEDETLGSEMAAFRAEMAAFRVAMAVEMSAIKIELATLRAMIDAKPDKSTVYQAVLSTGAAALTVVAGTVILLKSIA